MNTRRSGGNIYVAFMRLFEERQGPFVEVGGPTSKGYPILGDGQLPKPVTVTNSDRCVPSVEKVVKAQHTLFESASLGVVFAFGLPYVDHKFYPFGKFDLHKAFISQAKRCLEESGILVMQTGTQSDLEYAVGLGFTPVRVLEDTATSPAAG